MNLNDDRSKTHMPSLVDSFLLRFYHFVLTCWRNKRRMMKIASSEQCVAHISSTGPRVDPGGVQGVRTPVLLITVPFLERTFLIYTFLVEQRAPLFVKTKQELNHTH